MAETKLVETVQADWAKLQAEQKRAVEELMASQQRQMQKFIETHGLPPASQKRLDDLVNQYGFKVLYRALDKLIWLDLTHPDLPEEHFPSYKDRVAEMSDESPWKAKCLEAISDIEARLEKAASEDLSADKLLEDIPMSESVKQEVEKRKAGKKS